MKRWHSERESAIVGQQVLCLLQMNPTVALSLHCSAVVETSRSLVPIVSMLCLPILIQESICCCCARRGAFKNFYDGFSKMLAASLLVTLLNLSSAGWTYYVGICWYYEP